MFRFKARFRRLQSETASTVRWYAALLLIAHACCACPFGFNPGWANGWPGVSKHTVFAAASAMLLFTMIVTLGVAIFIVPCSYFERVVQRDFVGWGTFAV